MPFHFESNPLEVAAPDGHFSQCTVVPGTPTWLFISGQVPRDGQGLSVGQDNMTAQAEQVFANLQAVLAAHGASFANVVKATIFVTRMDLAHEVTAVRQRYYGAHKPASTFVAVGALGDPDWWLEVELIAAIAPRQDFS
jgi:2-iminobutanoate/2-iminopropanoate deaminase